MNTFAGFGTTRIRWIVVLSFAAACMVAGVARAGAAPVVVAVTPLEGAVVTSTAMPVVSALVADAVTPISGVMIVDGITRPAVADATGLSLSYTPAATARLADGTHTVIFNATDALGSPISKSWSFEVQQIPNLNSPNPAQGSVTTARKPYVGIIVYDNSLAATYTVTVDGVRLSGLSSSGYEATFGGYYGIGGYPVSNLADGPHTAYARVTDPGGHTVERTWTIVVNGEIIITADGISEGQVYTTAQPTWHFLGRDVYTSPINFTMWVDGRQTNLTLLGYTMSNGNRNLDVTGTPATPLTDGAHTVMPMFWDSKMSASRSFNIQIQAPPTVFHLRPSTDVVVTTSTPTLVARATDNSTGTPTFEFALDGVKQASEPVRTIATSRWEGTAKVSTPLSSNATHTATVTVRDVSGNTTIRTWEFFVASGEKMSHYSAGSCPDCHGNPYYPHAANGGDGIVNRMQYACNNCHSVFPDHTYYGWYKKPMVAAQIDDPATFIPSPWQASTCSCHGGHPYHMNAAYCQNCHDRINTINEQGEPPLGRGETITLVSETPRHVVDGDYGRCVGCHQLDLTFEHAGRTNGAGSAITCLTCHASADARVTNAIAAGNGRCDACHPDAGAHPHSTAPIEGVEAGDGHLCTECHSGDVIVEHSKATAGGNPDPCLTCHAGGRARGAKGGATSTDCDTPACHGEASAQPMHSTYCAGCHENENTDFSVKQTGFRGAQVAKSKCLACHGAGITTAGSYKTGRRWRSARHLSHNATDECASCHYWSQRRTEFYTQTVTGPYGAFASAESTSPTPARAHSVHTSGSWAGGIEFAPNIYCANCHQATGCTSCHGSGAIPATHASHGTQPTQTVMVAKGAPSYTTLKQPLAAETRSCTAAPCHGSAAATVPTCTSCHTDRAATHW